MDPGIQPPIPGMGMHPHSRGRLVYPGKLSIRAGIEYPGRDTIHQAVPRSTDARRPYARECNNVPRYMSYLTSTQSLGETQKLTTSCTT